MKQRTKTDRSRPDWTARFLDMLQRGLSVRKAWQLSGCSRSNVYQRRAADPAFDARFRDAVEDGTDLLEEQAVQRAMSKTDPSDAPGATAGRSTTRAGCW
jgi:hypothetical protein